MHNNKPSENAFFGTHLSNPLVLLHIGRIEMNADWNFQNLCSPFLRIYYVEHGQAEVFIHNKTYQLTPGHIYMIPPFTRHSDQCNGPFTHYYLHILDQQIQKNNIYEQNNFPFEIKANAYDLDLFKRLVELNPDSFLKHSIPSTYDNSQTIMQVIQRFNQHTAKELYEMEAIMMMLVSRFYRQAVSVNETNDNRVLQVQQYVLQHISESLSLEELAEMVGVCKDSLIRIFKRETGMTPVEFILNKRIEKAQIALLTQASSIHDIAIQLGFGNQSYFASLFKRMMGITPLQYRKQNQL